MRLNVGQELTWRLHAFKTVVTLEINLGVYICTGWDVPMPFIPIMTN